MGGVSAGFSFCKKGTLGGIFRFRQILGTKFRLEILLNLTESRKLGERRSAGAEADNSSVTLSFRPEVSVTLQGLPTEKSTALSNTFTTIRKHR